MKFLTPAVLRTSLTEVATVVVAIAIATALLELAVYFLWGPLGALSRSVDRALRPLGKPIRTVISALLILGVVVFAVQAVSIGRTPSTVARYWPLALLAFLVGAFVAPVAIKVFDHELRLPYMLLAPAIVGLVLLVVFPLLWEFRVSMTNLSPKYFQSPTFVGLKNYIEVFTMPVLKQVRFFPVFLRTVLWTLVNVVFHVGGGLGLALLLNRKMRLKGFYRALLVLPWAIPQVIACLAWRSEFHFVYGFPNLVLQRLGMAAIQWKTNPSWNFVAMCITNIWLGIPFMMVIILGGLQSIAGDYYEAAELDGASSFQQFRNVTLPLLQPVLTPAVILGTVWTFTNFNVPYFINENELETSDTLVTALFRSAFQYFNLGDAAAFAFVIFAILLIFTVFYMRATGTLKGATE
jgi:arabinogalactan oligomer/maltooligosaccharide transport system permease protein